MPLLVPRANTERGESLATDFVRLVAVDRRRIVEAALALLAAPRRAPVPFDADAPYGAGDAAARIVAVLERSFGTPAEDGGVARQPARRRAGACVVSAGACPHPPLRGTLARSRERVGVRGPAAPAAALARWLLAGPAQLAAGPHAGAVAGCVDAGGRAGYAYPEITGYFLHWLAWRAAAERGRRTRTTGIGTATADAAGLRARATAAQGWLARWIDSDAPPPTRVPLGAAAADWRNDAVFCFDLAMVLRGLAAVVSERLLLPDPSLVGGLAAQLRALIGTDGAFEACRPRRRGVVLPRRWSTRRGGFLAKAATGVIAAAEALPAVPPDLVAAAEATLAQSLDAAIAAPHVDVHPLLYTLEGALGRPAHPRCAQALPALAVQFDALLAAAGAHGGVPASLAPGTGDDAPARFDVLAQALRAGHALARLRPHAPPDATALARLRDALEATIRPGGAIPFAAGDGAALDSVWATMFAEQALRVAEPGGDESARALPAQLLV